MADVYREPYAEDYIEPYMNEEIELIKKWVKEREDFINE